MASHHTPTHVSIWLLCCRSRRDTDLDALFFQAPILPPVSSPVAIPAQALASELAQWQSAFEGLAAEKNDMQEKVRVAAHSLLCLRQSNWLIPPPRSAVSEHRLRLDFHTHSWPSAPLLVCHDSTYERLKVDTH